MTITVGVQRMTPLVYGTNIKEENKMTDNIKYRPLPDGLYIGNSPIEGNGLFTSRELKDGEELGITHIRYNSEDFHSNYIRTPVGGFMNHSTTPNCVLYECGAYLKAKVVQTINPGDELTLAYNLYDPCKNYMETNK